MATQTGVWGYLSAVVVTVHVYVLLMLYLCKLPLIDITFW